MPDQTPSESEFRQLHRRLINVHEEKGGKSFETALTYLLDKHGVSEVETRNVMNQLKTELAPGDNSLAEIVLPDTASKAEKEAQIGRLGSLWEKAIKLLPPGHPVQSLFAEERPGESGNKSSPIRGKIKNSSVKGEPPIT
jgi:hypothetical protein